MQRVDIVIVALVIIALGGSILGVMFYEPPGDPRWELSFSTETGSERAAQFSNLPGDAVWQLDQENVTLMEFSLVAQGSAAARLAAVSITVEITSPEGNMEPATLTLPQGTGQSAEGSIRFELRDRPADETVEAPDAEAALPEPGREGTGGWTIKATRSGAGVLPPETISLSVDASYRYYVGDVSRHFPDLGQAA